MNIIPLPRGHEIPGGNRQRIRPVVNKTEFPYVPPPERLPLLSVGQAVSLFMGLTIGGALLWALLAAMLVQG